MGLNSLCSTSTSVSQLSSNRSEFPFSMLDQVDVEVDRGVDGGGQVADVGQVVHPQRPGKGIIRLQ